MSIAVPHSTAFLPPAFMATFPPIQEASTGVDAISLESDIDREYAACGIGRFHNATCDDAGAAVDRCNRLRQSGQRSRFHTAQSVEFFGVDHRGILVQWNGTAGVAGAAAARNDGQAELDARLHDRLHFILCVRMQHNEGILHAPVGRVGHMRNAREAVEGNVVAARYARELAQYLAPQFCGFVEIAREIVDGLVPGREQPGDFRVDPFGFRIDRLAVFGTALLDLAQPVTQRLDQRVATARIVEHVVLQIRIAIDDPDIAQHFVEHARRTARAAFAAQFVEQLPHRRTQQANDDFAIRERGVVVRDLAQADPGGSEGGNGMHLLRTA